mgnify:CR=1 FL=1
MPVRLLVVEDHAPFRQLICTALQRRAEFEIIEAVDGVEAVQKAESLHPEEACARIQAAVPVAMDELTSVRPPEFDGGGGRGHQGTAFSMVLAGGGLKHRGAHGETDDLSKTVVKDSVPDGPQNFSFTAGGGLSPETFQLDDDSDPTLSNTRTFASVPATDAWAVSKASRIAARMMSAAAGSNRPAKAKRSAGSARRSQSSQRRK